MERAIGGRTRFSHEAPESSTTEACAGRLVDWCFPEAARGRRRADVLLS
jgi:hypothetical protein